MMDKLLLEVHERVVHKIKDLLKEKTWNINRFRFFNESYGKHYSGRMKEEEK